MQHLDTHRSILVATLGTSWAVIPEVLGWAAPELVDLYAHHPLSALLQAQRHELGLRSLDEVWVLTTAGFQTRRSVAQLLRWWRALAARNTEPMPRLAVWMAQDTDELADIDECRRWREMAFRAVCAARHRVGAQGCLLLSLAGGRKTMSADLQDAAHAFGAEALMHIVANERFLRASPLANPQPHDLLQPWPQEVASIITPVVIGRTPGEPALSTDRLLARDPPDFWPLLQRPCQVLRWRPDAHASLEQRVQELRRQAQHLLVSHALKASTQEPYDPWPLLLRLDPGRINRLRQPGSVQLGAADPLADPSRWPLADLHRHLGGSLNLDAQHRVAEAILKTASPSTRARCAASLNEVWPGWNEARRLNQAPEDWPNRLRDAARRIEQQARLDPGWARALVCSCVLTAHETTGLQRLLWPPSEARVALKTRHPMGFAAYERPGELSGSALLGHPAAVEPYAQAIVQSARKEGLLYVELRGSPHKYRPNDPVGFVEDLQQALQAAGACTGTYTFQGPFTPRVGLIWIVDRRQRETASEVVRHAVRARERLPHFVLGMDLAGDEGTTNPAELANAFEPALHACMPITIHAGEGEAADHIWEAAYHLHADRIGHGLTLSQHPTLAQRFRDRGIALELCPSSNREVVGFRDMDFPASHDCPIYPLGDMMREGLPLTINTDNPSISRTTIANEYVAAARMHPGLSAWQALALLRLAYRHAFVPAAERRTLEERASEMLLEIATEGDPKPT
ncbi:MAG: CRISPR-associated ring nuclease [Tepidimonas sp.]|uniref:CRISPR-associated ring nuclease n=1 Tax=Tepidimonas sp. TaxID=2002775 RepID=UPI00298F352D|nr:CRISPR-associated ring nuclease [Tepidimonas sp.]MDW8336746.1 CRISPR-associated ring nuclease [Tepidimonas sp.]